MIQIRLIAVCFAVVVVFGCSTRNESTSKKNLTMNLNDAGTRLSVISGSSLRNYSTRDFGRDRYPEARSVIVPKARARQVLQALRSELGPGLIAFIGTTQWLGDEKHEDGEEVVVANGDSQFDILRVARSDAVNYDMVTDDLIKKLTEYHRKYDIDIFHAETDTIEFRFSKLPADLAVFCNDLYKFCPDIVDQGVGTVEDLENVIRRSNEVLLWWD